MEFWIKMLIFYVVMIFLVYLGLLKLMKHEIKVNIVKKYQLFIISIFWILLITSGILLVIIDLFRGKRNVLEKTKEDK